MGFNRTVRWKVAGPGHKKHRHQGRHETTWGIKNDWGRTICREPWFLHQIFSCRFSLQWIRGHSSSTFHCSEWSQTDLPQSDSIHPGDYHSITASLHNVKGSAEAPLGTFGTSATPKYGQRKQVHVSWFQSVEILHAAWIWWHRDILKCPYFSKVMRFFPWFSNGFSNGFSEPGASLGAPHSAVKHTVDHKANEMLRRIH